MKIFKPLSKILVILTIFSAISASALDEGVDYQLMKNPLQDEKNSVIEVFSFMCIHCYTHHKQGTMEKLKQAMPNLEYKIYPVKSINFGEEFAQLYAYAEAKDEANGLNFTSKNALTHKLSDAYFMAVFERKQRWNDSHSFYDVGLKTLNIDKKQLDSFLASSEGKKIYANYDKAYSIASQYGGTPAFLVAGKYIVDMKNIKSLEQFIQTIDSLNKMK